MWGFFFFRFFPPQPCSLQSSGGEVYTHEAHHLHPSDNFSIIGEDNASSLDIHADSTTEPLLLFKENEDAKEAPTPAASAPAPTAAVIVADASSSSLQARLPSETIEYQALKDDDEHSHSLTVTSTSTSLESPLSRSPHSSFSNAIPFSQLIQEHMSSNVTPIKEQMEGV